MLLLICIQLSFKILNYSTSSVRHGWFICHVVHGVAWIPLKTYFFFILNFSLPYRSEQLIVAIANEIKHYHSPVVIVVLDNIYH